MTIPELLISFALIAVVLVGTQQLLTTGIRYYTESMEALDVQREALGAMSTIASDLGASNMVRMEWFPDPDLLSDPKEAGLLIPSVFDVNGDYQTDNEGRLLWQGVTAFYQSEEQGVDVLIKKYTPLLGGPVDSPPDALAQTPPLDLAFFRLAPGGGILARHVEEFALQETAPPHNDLTNIDTQADVVQFRMVIRIDSIAGRKYTTNGAGAVNRLALTSRAYPRN